MPATTRRLWMLLFVPSSLSFSQTLLSSFFYPGEMSLRPASSVKLASQKERSAQGPCSDCLGIPPAVLSTFLPLLSLSFYFLKCRELFLLC